VQGLHGPSPFDGTLHPETARALEQHLEGCPECLNFNKTYKATNTRVREITYEEMPEELNTRLASFLKAKLRRENVGWFTHEHCLPAFTPCLPFLAENRSHPWISIVQAGRSFCNLSE
jgi:hypothetical protein